MYEQLRAHFEKKITLTDADFQKAVKFFVPKKIRKGQFLLHEGDIGRYGGYVNKGCLRQYSIDDKGEEHIVQFAIEDWWISDMYSSLTGTPAKYNIDALENSEVLSLDARSQEQLCLEVPVFERFFRLLLQGAFIAKERRIMASLSESAEQQYLDFQKAYPQIAQRVPLNQIASYLGITPQSLSRIRKEMVEKK